MKLHLTRHGQSEYNVEDRLGGDPPLTDLGVTYSHALYHYASTNNLLDTVFCSPKLRAMQTIEPMRDGIRDLLIRESLVEISAGTCEDKTYREVEIEHPDVSSARKDDKLNFRYPQGESYVDLIERVRQICGEIRQLSGDVLVVCHRAVIRAILFHFDPNISISDVPHVPIPLHSIISVNTETGERENVDIMK